MEYMRNTACFNPAPFPFRRRTAALAPWLSLSLIPAVVLAATPKEKRGSTSAEAPAAVKTVPAATVAASGISGAVESLANAAPASLPEVRVLGEALADPQSKPVSASFLSAELLRDFRVAEPQDIVRITPNASATDSGSRSFGDVYNMRGLTNTVFFGAPATTIYLDDVPFGETFTYAQRLSALNSVEVLRGPQPTLVGRNAYAGLINIQSRKPIDIYEGSLNYSYGSKDANAVDGWLMGPIVGEELGFRIGGQYDSRDGYLWNPILKDHVDDQEHWGVNGGLFWKPARGWEVSLTASYDDYNDGAPRLTSLDRNDFYEVNSNVRGEQKRQTDNEALRVSYEAEKWKFLSVTSRRNWDLDPYIADLDFLPSNLGYVNLRQDQQLWSQEFRFSSNDPNSDWQWNAGAYGSWSEIHGNGDRFLNFQQSQVNQFVNTFDQPIPTPYGIFMIPLTARSTATSLTDVNVIQNTTHEIREDALALFGGVDYSGLKPFTFHLGARLDYVERRLDRQKSTKGTADTDTTVTTSIDPVPGFPPFPSPAPTMLHTVTPVSERSPDLHFSDDWFHITPTAGIDWHVTDDSMVYAKTAFAFKPGGFSAYADDPQYVPFGDERTWATELGVKSQWMDGRLITNLAGFWNETRDYQVERSFTQVDYAVFNAERARSYGLEFESKFEICPQLDFLGSIGWTHARLTHYTDPVTGQNLDGVTPPFVPEMDATVSLDFHLAAGFFTQVSFTALGDTKFDDFNRSEFQQDAFGLLSASIGWRAKNWNIAAYATNLTEEEYYTNMNTDVRTGAPGAPREFGVRVGVTF